MHLILSLSWTDPEGGDLMDANSTKISFASTYRYSGRIYTILYPATIVFVLIMPSALYACCIYSNALQTIFFMEANNMNHDEHADLGPYFFQCRLNQNISRREEQTTKVVTGSLRVNTSEGILTVSQNRDSADRSV